MIQDTVYSLTVRLQRVDEKLEGYTSPNTQALSVSLDDEKEVTKLCLRICEDARNFLESLRRESTVLQTVQNTAEDEEQKYFDAQMLTHRTLAENQDSFTKIIGQLRNRLETLVMRNDSIDDKERSRLLDDISASKQCLEICKLASETSHKKIYRIGEVIADGDSDQAVVNTLADLFDIRKAISRGTSTQLVGSMTDESFQYATERRYASRFGVSVQGPNATHTASSSTPAIETKKDSSFSPSQTGLADPESRMSNGGHLLTK